MGERKKMCPGKRKNKREVAVKQEEGDVRSKRVKGSFRGGGGT